MDSTEKEMASAARAAGMQKMKETAKAAEERKTEAAAGTMSPPPSVQNTERAVPEVKMNDAGEEREGEKNGSRAPNSGNGLDLESYSWTQTLQEVAVNVPIPRGTDRSSVVYAMKNNHLKVGLEGQPPIIEGELFQDVKPSVYCYSREDQSAISIRLTKHNRMEWWKCLTKGEPEVDIQKIEPEISNLSDFNPETNEIVEEMMSNLGQQSVDLPTTDEILEQEILKIMTENPETHFSRAKLL